MPRQLEGRAPGRNPGGAGSIPALGVDGVLARSAGAQRAPPAKREARRSSRRNSKSSSRTRRMQRWTTWLSPIGSGFESRSPCASSAVAQRQSFVRASLVVVFFVFGSAARQGSARLARGKVRVRVPPDPWANAHGQHTLCVHLVALSSRRSGERRWMQPTARRDRHSLATLDWLFFMPQQLDWTSSRLRTGRVQVRLLPGALMDPANARRTTFGAGWLERAPAVVLHTLVAGLVRVKPTGEAAVFQAARGGFDSLRPLSLLLVSLW